MDGDSKRHQTGKAEDKLRPKNSLRILLGEFKKDVRKAIQLTCPPGHRHLFEQTKEVNHRLESLGVWGHQPAVKGNVVLAPEEIVLITNAILMQKSGITGKVRP